jgi:hypothetical protein
MRRRAERVKLSMTTTYKVRNLGDIGDANYGTTGWHSLKCIACFALDFAIASTNLLARQVQQQIAFRPAHYGNRLARHLKLTWSLFVEA